jgi:hypothetical protein
LRRVGDEDGVGGPFRIVARDEGLGEQVHVLLAVTVGVDAVWWQRRWTRTRIGLLR